MRFNPKLSRVSATIVLLLGFGIVKEASAGDVITCKQAIGDRLSANDLRNGAVISDESFASDLIAATAAATRYARISAQENKEYIGLVVKFKTAEGAQRFCYTALRSAEMTENSAAITIRKDMLADVTSLWHTHGRIKTGDNSELFSGSDYGIVHQLRKPFYMMTARMDLYVLNLSDRGFSPNKMIMMGFLGDKYPMAEGTALGNRTNWQVPQETAVEGGIASTNTEVERSSAGLSM